MTPRTPMLVTDFIDDRPQEMLTIRPSLWGHTAGHALLALLFDQPGPQGIQAPRAAWKGQSLPKKHRKIMESIYIYKSPLKSWGFTLKMMGERMVILFLEWYLQAEGWKINGLVRSCAPCFWTQGAILHEFSIQVRCHQPKHATTGTKCVGNWMILWIVQFTGPRSSSIIYVIQQLRYMIGIRMVYFQLNDWINNKNSDSLALCDNLHI